MSTRNLTTNNKRAIREADKIISFTSDELEKSYREALKDIRSKIAVLFEQYKVTGEFTSAQATRFMRLSGIEKEILSIMAPYLTANEKLLKDMSVVSYDSGYFNTAWAMDQATGLDIGWSVIDDAAVRAVIGIGGDSKDLSGLLTQAEIKQHNKIMIMAFRRYDQDTQNWISHELRKGIIQGDSVQDLVRRLKENALIKSYNSAEKIARTEVLRSSGIGTQISYEDARDYGVDVKEIWDATLDSRTRPDHAAADGKVMDNETKLFSVFGGQYPGPNRTGIAKQDIQCRCYSNGVIEGYEPETRRIRGEGLQPYQTFKTWANKHGYTTNRYGQKYKF